MIMGSGGSVGKPGNEEQDMKRVVSLGAGCFTPHPFRSSLIGAPREVAPSADPTSGGPSLQCLSS